MRRVSGDSRRRRRRRRTSRGARAAASAGADAGAFGSAVAVAISDTIKRFDLRELAIDRLELLAQPFDVAVDGAIVDIDVLAIGAVHQLIAALDMTGPQR